MIFYLFSISESRLRQSAFHTLQLHRVEDELIKGVDDFLEITQFNVKTFLTLMK